MTKARSSRSGPLTSGLPLASSLIFAETRSQVQKPTHKDLKPKWPKPDHLGFRPLMLRFLNAPAHALIETRSSAQKPACKDPERNDQGPVITFRAAYIPVSNRADSRSAVASIRSAC